MEAGLQDYFVPMTGSVTVDRDEGIHYTSTEPHVVETIYPISILKMDQH